MSRVFYLDGYLRLNDFAYETIEETAIIIRSPISIVEFPYSQTLRLLSSNSFPTFDLSVLVFCRILHLLLRHCER